MLNSWPSGLRRSAVWSQNGCCLFRPSVGTQSRNAWLESWASVPVLSSIPCPHLRVQRLQDDADHRADPCRSTGPQAKAGPGLKLIVDMRTPSANPVCTSAGFVVMVACPQESLRCRNAALEDFLLKQQANLQHRRSSYQNTTVTLDQTAHLTLSLTCHGLHRLNTSA